MIICSEEAARWSQQPCCLQVVTMSASYVEHPPQQQDMCGWPWSASSTLSSSHLPHLASHQCSKFGKVVFCEVALCPGMRSGGGSPASRETSGLCLWQNTLHREWVLLSCGFPSLSWIWAESWLTKEGKNKQSLKEREKAWSTQGCTWLWHSSVPERGWEILLFHSKFRKIQPQALRPGVWLVCLTA